MFERVEVARHGRPGLRRVGADIEDVGGRRPTIVLLALLRVQVFCVSPEAVGHNTV
jgi:hypothetical protein